MMKLRHLFDSPALARMLLENWEYDEPSLELFQYFRISANAIYPFRKNDEVRLLRFCPIKEKFRENILAELDFIAYLRDRRFNALEAVPSKTGDKLMQKATPWGEFYASVFKRVKGDQISESDFNDEIIFAYGAALGQLHKLSSEYVATGARRWTHVDVFGWIEEALIELRAGTSALDELHLLREYFPVLPVNKENYGLIHYDFELDNVFYDGESKSCSVIDFDDAMYHWYVMDIVKALESLEDEIGAVEFPHKKVVFIDGYRSRFGIDDNLLAAAPIFGRFASLYRYTRDARSMQESWENEPEWMVELRGKLTRLLDKDSENFGKPIEACL